MIEPFLPPELPPQVDLRPMVPAIGRANHALGRLNGILYALPNPELLLSPFLTKEAVLSSRIEGTQASIVDVFGNEARRLVSETTELERDVREIVNYRRALLSGIKEIRKRPIGENVMKKMHRILLDSVRGAGSDRGNFRRSQVFIGKAGAQIEDATFIPPAANEVSRLIANWERYFHADNAGVDDLVKIAILHYQFEAIHPFLDGNGRVGRLLISLSLFDKGLLNHPILYISEFFEEHRQQYYDLLLGVSRVSAWPEWIAFFLQAIAVQSERAEKTAKRILELYSELKHEAALMNSPYALKFLDIIFAQPVFTFASLKEQLGTKAQQTVYNLIGKFIGRGIVRERGRHKRNRQFEFPKLLNLLK